MTLEGGAAAARWSEAAQYCALRGRMDGIRALATEPLNRFASMSAAAADAAETNQGMRRRGEGRSERERGSGRGD